MFNFSSVHYAREVQNKRGILPMETPSPTVHQPTTEQCDARVLVASGRNDLLNALLCFTSHKHLWPSQLFCMVCISTCVEPGWVKSLTLHWFNCANSGLKITQNCCAWGFKTFDSSLMKKGDDTINMSFCKVCSKANGNIPQVWSTLWNYLYNLIKYPFKFLDTSTKGSLQMTTSTNLTL